MVKGIIRVTGMKFYAYHGFYPEEREKGGWYVVDVELEAEVTNAAENDDLDGTVNYEKVYAGTEKAMQTSCKLIEHLAHNIVIEIKESVPVNGNVTVTVHKLNPPLPGEIKETSVTIKG